MDDQTIGGKLDYNKGTGRSRVTVHGEGDYGHAIGGFDVTDDVRAMSDQLDELLYKEYEYRKQNKDLPLQQKADFDKSSKDSLRKYSRRPRNLRLPSFDKSWW